MTKPAVKSPAFQFYPDDFLGSGKVGTMTTEEVGAYVLLVCLEWNETGFVFDEEELSRWCRMPRARFRAAWRRVSRSFVERDGRMYNPRLDVERAKQAEWREKSRKGGLTSAQSRAKGGSTVVQPPYEPTAQPNADQSPTLQSPTPVSTTKKTSRPASQSWVARLAECWHADVGHLAAGRIGRDAKSFVDTHGEDRFYRAMRGYIAVQKSAGKPPRWAWFIAEAQVWIDRTAAVLDVVDGEMSDTLELLTRPGRMSA